MRTQVTRAAVAVAVILLCPAALLAQSGFGGLGGFGGGFGGIGAGSVPPDVPSVRPWLGINGHATKTTYEDERTRFQYGSTIAGGLNVSRGWQRTGLAGSYTFIAPLANNFNRSYMGRGSSHVGGIQVMHQFSQRLTWNLSGMFGSSNGGYGFGGGIGGFAGLGTGMMGGLNSPIGMASASSQVVSAQNLADNGLVDNELFSARVNFAGINTGLSYAVDQRNHFSVNAGANRVRRDLDYLVGVNSVGFGGGYSRLISDRLTTGVQYALNLFEYPGYYGGNQIHSVGWNLRYTITPTVHFNMNLGGYLYRVNNITTVRLPQEMADLLGAATVQTVNDMTHRGFMGGATLGKSFRVGSARVSYFRGARPGYGLLFATQHESVTTGYSVGVGRVSLGASALYSRGKSISSLAGSTQNKALMANASLRLFGGLHATGSAAHHWIKVGNGSHYKSVAATLGIAFSPGSYPLWF